ncbi:MAG: OmpA family protein [Rubrivivax sp.]|nr:OmpA family protein [Rubrivivax sp.]
MSAPILRCLAAGLLALLPWTDTAAADPDTRAMIEALKPAPAEALPGASRNLYVRRRADDAAAVPGAPAGAPSAPAEPPSLSLAIPFELNSARLRPESGPLLGDLVAAMISPELRAHRFLIEGHTDASGAPAANQRLSLQRAEEVRLYLVTLGVAPERLRAVGRGASAPVNRSDPRAPENRRVRVVTLP